MDARELELIHRAQAGDESAFAALLEPVLEEALRFAYGMLQRHCEAQDCVQEAAVRSWDRLGNLQPGRPFGPWFRGIVANRCREQYRGRWWSVKWLSDKDPPSHFDWLAGEELRLAGEDLRRALARLPLKLREAVVLRFYVGLSEKEVAATLGIRVSAVGARVNRALKMLRRWLGEGG